MIDLVEIGKIKKTVGVNGDLNFYLYDEIDPKSLDNLKFLFFNLNGSKVPFRLDYLNLETMQFRIDQKSIEPLQVEFVGTEINIEAGSIIRIQDDVNNTYLQRLLGYQIQLPNGSDFGIIEDYIDYGTHINLEVKKSDKLINVPFHEDFVLETKESLKIIVLDLPEGL